jgi:YidC/Oxa1 family membrane protein insertase
VLNELGEATLRSLGVGSYFTPVGWIQLLLEYLHVETGLPWYQCIVIIALIIRTLLIPITIKSQRNAAKMRKVMPQMMMLNEKLSAAKMTGNHMDSIESIILYSIDYMKMII